MINSGWGFHPLSPVVRNKTMSKNYFRVILLTVILLVPPVLSCFPDILLWIWIIVPLIFMSFIFLAALYRSLLVNEIVVGLFWIWVILSVSLVRYFQIKDLHIIFEELISNFILWSMFLLLTFEKVKERACISR